jgi:hypothetical protein
LAIFIKLDGFHICWICKKPVSLEECKIDEDGKAMHEKCYVSLIAEDHPAGGPLRFSQG